MNVYQNIAYGLKVTRRPEAEVRQRVEEAVNQVGLMGLEQRPVAALSRRSATTRSPGPLVGDATQGAAL